MSQHGTARARMTAMMAVQRGSVPNPAARPPDDAGGISVMTTGNAARDIIWAMISGAAGLTNETMIDAFSSTETISARVPYAPIRLSRMMAMMRSLSRP